MQDSIWTSGELRYALTGLTNGVTYDVQLRAANGIGPAHWSATMQGTPKPVLGAPIISSLTLGDGYLTVAWNAPSDTGRGPVTAYDLRYIRSDAADKADANWTVQDSIWTSGELRYTLTGLTNGVTYDVQLRAANGVDPAYWSATMQATPTPLPGAPIISSLTLGDGYLTVAWNAPSNTGRGPVTAYDLRYIRSDAADKADANWTVQDSIWTSGSLEYTLTGLTKGVTYDVQVRAVNSVGNGAWSASVSGKPRTVPQAPRTYGKPENGGIDLWWGGPEDDGGSEVTGYDVRYIRSDAPDKADANWTLVQNTGTSPSPSSWPWPRGRRSPPTLSESDRWFRRW